MVVEKVRIKEIIGGRFDNSFVLYHHKTSEYKYPVFPLNRFLLEKPQYGSGEAGMPRDNIDMPRYIRITDIDDNGFLIDSIGVTAKRIEKKYILRNNDILIARSGNTVGKSYIHKSDSIQDICFFAGYLIRFIVDSNLLLPDYFFIFTKLSFFSNWVKVTQRVAGQPNINAEEYSHLPIPVPSIEIQKNIVSVYQDAVRKRTGMINEAKQLINSIDDYLIKTLQIKNDRKVSKRIIQSNISYIVGGRIDVQFHIKNEMALARIRGVPHKPLGDIAIFSSETWDQKSLFKDVFPYIEINSVDIVTGEINDIEYVPFNKAPSRAKKIVRKNDILISTTRPNRGAICIYEHDDLSIASTGFAIIRNTYDDVLKEYLSIVLRSSISLEQMAIRSSGGNYPSIIESELKKVLVPVPSIVVQKEIINTVIRIKTKAKHLQEEGDRILEETKLKIEQLVLG